MVLVTYPKGVKQHIKINSAEELQSFLQDQRFESWIVQCFDTRPEDIYEIFDRGISDEEIIRDILELIPDRYFNFQYDNIFFPQAALDHTEKFHIDEIDMELIMDELYELYPKEWFSEKFKQDLLSRKI